MRKKKDLGEVLKALSVDGQGGCRIWTGTHDKHGYGRITRDWKGQLVHRVAYAFYCGEIPEGMTVDHLCFKADCINPQHLRLLPMMENARRQRKMLRQECGRGHPLAGDNLHIEYIQKKTGVFPSRRCRECTRINWRRSAERKKAARAGDSMTPANPRRAA